MERLRTIFGEESTERETDFSLSFAPRQVVLVYDKGNLTEGIERGGTTIEREGGLTRFEFI